MASAISLPRTLVVYVITIPLALMVGYLLTTPLNLPAMASMLAMSFFLTLPLLMRFHHAALVFGWNASITVFFLPGSPSLWMLMAVICVAFAIVNQVIERRPIFFTIPSISIVLAAFAALILVTAKLRGGIGIRTLGGSSYGGKAYLSILFAILGYFALAGTRIPLQKARAYFAGFFLSGTTAALGHVIFVAGPAFYFLFSIFSPESVMSHAAASITGEGLKRYTGVSQACIAIYLYLLGRYGVSGILNLNHPFRFIIFCLTFAGSLYGGFRSVLALFVIVFAIQFVLEGLHRTKLLPIAGALLLLGSAVVIPLTPHLPLQFQRTLSFLPVDVDASVRQDATASTEWRIGMWKALWPELPEYVVLGKGYSVRPIDIYMAVESQRRGLSPDWENFIVTGSFHNGFLTLFIPLGSFGVILFLVFLYFGFRTLRANYVRGDPSLRSINALLLALFSARIFFYFVIFGNFATDIYHFTGIVGLSVALNGAPKLKALRSRGQVPVPSGLPA